MTTLPTLSSPISPSSSPSQLSPTANNQPPKNKSPSSQHKSYFFKFCGHSICVLIYQSFFFLHAISVYKTIGNIFFTDSFSDRMRCYRWTLCRRKFSISDLVSKKITNELLISYRRNMFVGKTVKSVVLREFFSYLCLLMNTGIENYVGKGHCNIRTKQFWQYF
jgi:hypothetical protein